MKIAIAFSFAVLLAFASLILIACGSSAQQKAYVATDSGDPGCSVLPNIPCDAVPPSPSSCSGQTGTPGNGSALPLDASFPVGCQAYFRGFDCSSRGFCTCDAPDDAGTPARWNCHDVDGGT